jgi:hypothetical protein
MGYSRDLYEVRKSYLRQDPRSLKGYISTLEPSCLPSGSPTGAEAVAFFQTVVRLFQVCSFYAWSSNLVWNGTVKSDIANIPVAIEPRHHSFGDKDFHTFHSYCCYQSGMGESWFCAGQAAFVTIVPSHRDSRLHSIARVERWIVYPTTSTSKVQL